MHNYFISLFSQHGFPFLRVKQTDLVGLKILRLFSKLSQVYQIYSQQHNHLVVVQPLLISKNSKLAVN